MNTQYYQKYISKIITAKPVVIILKRQIKTDDGYGGVTSTDTFLSTQQFHFYDKKYVGEIISDAGKAYSSIIGMRSKMLCLSDADIEGDDTLVYQGNTYKVINVKTYMDVCKQIELEVIQ